MSTTKHEHRGITFEIRPRGVSQGLMWVVATWDHGGFQSGRESSGSFYDDCEGHPQDARVWAEQAARAYIDGILSIDVDSSRGKCHLCGNFQLGTYRGIFVGYKLDGCTDPFHDNPRLEPGEVQTP